MDIFCAHPAQREWACRAAPEGNVKVDQGQKPAGVLGYGVERCVSCNGRNTFEADFG
jgi:hypothetical protein